jgi:hypothetical protein
MFRKVGCEGNYMRSCQLSLEAQKTARTQGSFYLTLFVFKVS